MASNYKPSITASSGDGSLIEVIRGNMYNLKDDKWIGNAGQLSRAYFRINAEVRGFPTSVLNSTPILTVAEEDMKLNSVRLRVQKSSGSQAGQILRLVVLTVPECIVDGVYVEQPATVVFDESLTTLGSAILEDMLNTRDVLIPKGNSVHWAIHSENGKDEFNAYDTDIRFNFKGA